MSSRPQQQAPTLVLLHGLLGDSHDWAEVIAGLEGIHCLALDLPGHGQNHHVQVGSFEVFHHWLVDTLITHGVRHYCLLGYSLGGRLALYHASRQPPGLEALWLESAHPGCPPVSALPELRTMSTGQHASSRNHWKTYLPTGTSSRCSPT